jgi:hypothetical protein
MSRPSAFVVLRVGPRFNIAGPSPNIISHNGHGHVRNLDPSDNWYSRGGKQLLRHKVGSRRLTKSKVAKNLTSLLENIEQLMSQKKALRKLMPLQVKEKNRNDKRQFSKIFQYRGPDTETLILLTECCVHWWKNPSTFYERTMPKIVDSIDAQAHIIGCYLQDISDHT